MRQRKGIGGSVSGLVGVDDPQGGSRELDLSQMENYGFWSTKKWLTYQFSRTTGLRNKVQHCRKIQKKGRGWGFAISMLQEWETKEPRRV